LDRKPKDSDYRNIAKYIASGDCVLFLGAGISQGAENENGLPSATRLAEELFDNLSDAEKFIKKNDKESLAKVADVYDLIGDKKGLDSAIKERFASVKEPLEFHRLVSTLPFRIIITTNYDILLEEQFRRDEKEFVSISSCDDIEDWDEQKIIIFKIHGCVEKKGRLVVSESDYIRYLSDSKLSVFHDILKTLFYTKRILFIGYSISDINIKLILQTVENALGENKKKHYLVQGNKEITYELRKYLGDKGIELFNVDGVEFLENLNKHFNALNDEEKIGKRLNFYIDNFSNYRLSPLKFLEKKVLEKFEIDICKDNRISKGVYLYGDELLEVLRRAENQKILYETIRRKCTVSVADNVLSIISAMGTDKVSDDVIENLKKLTLYIRDEVIVKKLLSFLYEEGKLSEEEEMEIKETYNIPDVRQWIEENEDL